MKIENPRTGLMGTVQEALETVACDIYLSRTSKRAIRQAKSYIDLLEKDLKNANAQVKAFNFDDERIEIRYRELKTDFNDLMTKKDNLAAEVDESRLRICKLELDLEKTKLALIEAKLKSAKYDAIKILLSEEV